MIDIFLKSLPVFITIIIGYIIQKRNILKQNAVETLSTIAYKIVGPFFIFYVLYDIKIDTANFSIWLIPLTIFFLMILVSLIFFKLIKADNKTIGAVILCTTLFGAGAV